MPNLPSERTLHPVSFLFALAAHGRQLLVPGLLVLIAGARGGDDWQVWAMVLFVPIAIGAIVRTVMFRYRLEPDELVIRRGVMFRQQRHVPYRRIQNIDGVQNVVHRVLGVIDVRLETAGGQEPEAHLSVVSVPAFEELRTWVNLRRAGSPLADTGSTPAADGEPQVSQPPANEPPIAEPQDTEPRPAVLLHLSTRELIISGLIQGRGLLAGGALFGVLWESGLLDRVTGAIFGAQATGGGVVRQLVKAMFGRGIPPLGKIAITIAAFAALLMLTRVLSVGWALVRLHGFTLRREGDDLHADFGLLTRVAATIPIRRIQSVTVLEGPLHRVFGRVSVHVDTAGGESDESVRLQREWLAPVIQRSRVPHLLREILPLVDIGVVDWQPVDPRGVRRARVRRLAFAGIVSLMGIAMLQWWTPVVFLTLAAVGELDARKAVTALGWSLTSSGVFYRDGWLWRRQTVAPFSKIQAVALHESPFDRRLQMASIDVDTAGTSRDRHHIAVPYLSRAVADRFAAQLAAQAGRTAFRW